MKALIASVMMMASVVGVHAQINKEKIESAILLPTDLSDACVLRFVRPAKIGESDFYKVEEYILHGQEAQRVRDWISKNEKSMDVGVDHKSELFFGRTLFRFPATIISVFRAGVPEKMIVLSASAGYDNELHVQQDEVIQIFKKAKCREFYLSAETVGKTFSGFREW